VKNSIEKNNNGLSVAVIGMGCIFPKSAGLHEYWRLLYHGEDAVTEVPSTHWSPEDYFDSDPDKPDHTYCKRGGYLPPISFDPTEFGIPPANLEATDSSQLLSLVTAKMALDDAGYGSGKPFNRDRTSVILGVTGTQELVIPLGARLGFPKWRRALETAGIPDETARDVMEQISASYVGWQENSFPGLLGNVVAGRICNRLDLNGTNCVVDAACASSMSALHLALMELSSGRSDMVLTGGVDSLNDIFMHMCFAKTHILSPTGDARPFSDNADGTVLGEGIGMVVLKRLSDAEKDGDRIYAVIRGIGTSSDGKSQSIYAPRADGQAKALKMAYETAGVDPATVGLVETHGTGTRVGDVVEFTALKQVFGQTPSNGRRCAIGSVKSMIGHTKAAAGSAGLIKTILSLYHKVLPPTLKVTSPDPKLEIEKSPFYLNTETRPWLSENGKPRRAGVSAFGFGGSNFHAVLEEYRPAKQAPAWDGSVEIVALSAQSETALTANLDRLKKVIADAPDRQSIALAAAATRKKFSHADPYRLTFVLDRPTMIANRWSERIEEVVGVRSSRAGKSLPAVDLKQVYSGGPQPPGQLSFVFPGQGSQYVGMGQDLISVFPEAFQVLQDAARLDLAGAPLGDIIFPSAMLSETERKELSQTLRRTDIAQPAIGAVSLAMLNVMRYFGIEPDRVCGHSFGELTALQAAGWMDPDTLLDLARERGRCMADAGAGNGADSGSMLAVKADLKKLEKLITENSLDLVLANRNSPDQGVLSGAGSEIDRAETILRDLEVRCVRLSVSAAFHSKLMRDAHKPFLKALASARLKAPKMPVYANTTAKPYPADIDRAVGLLADQLLNPVDFSGCVEQLYADGVRCFIEVGPRKVLTGLIGSILKGREVSAAALDASAGAHFGTGDLARVLCRLAAAGYPVRLDRWERSTENVRQPKMRIPITGANYRTSEKPSRRQLPKNSAIQKPLTAPPAEQPVQKQIPPMPTLPPAAQPDIPNLKPMREDPQATTSIRSVANALEAVQEGLRSMQSLQQQTAAVHQKFLETQQESGRTLQAMMENIQRMATVPIDPAPAEPPGERFSSPARPLAAEAMPSQVLVPPLTAAAISSKPADTKAPLSDQGPVRATAPVPRKESAPESDATVKKALLQVVSELTGYPPEMIGLDMDIESDLGIDSIKRVEILSALEERLPNLPAVAPETMGTMKTLGHILDTLDSNGKAESKATTPVEASVPAPAVASAGKVSGTAIDTLTEAMLAVVSELTGYPADMIGLDMDIESDLGIDSIKRVEILSALEQQMPGMPSVSPDVMGTLKTLGQIIDTMSADTAVQPPESAPVTDPGAPEVAAPSGGNGSRPATQQDITAVMLSVVSELTGYPADMIGLDMDIESDLGIDSIKRVEILSSLESRVPQLPSVPPEVMGSLKTLGQIADFLSNGTDIGTTAPQAPDTQSGESVSEAKKVEDSQLEVVPVARRIVRTVERELKKSRPITLPADRKIFITDDQTGLARELADALSRRNHNTVIISTDILKYKEQLPPAAGLIILHNPESPHPADDLLQAFLLARHLAPSLNDSAAVCGSFFATVTRLDGAFGFKGKGVQQPLSGGLTGLAKTAAIEWERVHCRAIDLDPYWQNFPVMAENIAAELLYTDPKAAIEIGLNADQRFELRLESAPVKTDDAARIQLSGDDVIIISGGARGVTAATALTLAEQTGATLALLGRSPEPRPEPGWLQAMTTEAEIKKAILQYEYAGKLPTPKELEASYRSHRANREIMQNLNRIRKTGSKVAYFAVDVRDADKVKALLDDVRKTLGPISGLVHGAGILEDRLIVDKTAQQFEKVFSTKVEGLKALLQATARDNLRTMVFFSSIAGRMGNKGQVDYAMANEVLNKTAQQQAAERPDCRIVSINWGPWDGGMVTPALKHQFERMGISLISMGAGARAMLDEFSIQNGGPVEVVIGGSLQPGAASELNGNEDVPQDKQADNTPDLALTFKREVDVQRFPILGDHILDGKPVVPLALMSEWFGHSALHGNPGLYLHGLDDVRVLKGIKIEEKQKLVRLFAGKARRSGTAYEVDLEIRNGFAGGVDVIHSRARAVLVDQLAEPPQFEAPMLENPKPYKRSIEDVYQKILFHGTALRGIQAIAHLDSGSMVAEIAPAPAPADWMKEPLRKRWLTDPLVLDSAFQMAIVWCFEEKGKVSLPTYFSAYRQYRSGFPKEAVTVVMEVISAHEKKMKSDFTFLDRKRNVIARLSGYEAVMDNGLLNAFKHKSAEAPQRV